MKFLFALLLVSVSLAHASDTIKPGLWRVSIKMEQDGKEQNVNAQMEKAMANLPPEQKKQMLAMMKAQMKNDFLSDKGSKVCYTEDMLKDSSSFTQPNDECKSEITKQTKDTIKTKVKCKNGSKGTGVWNRKSNEAYDGVMNISSPDGKQAKMTYTGKFLAKDCGDVKPFKQKK